MAKIFGECAPGFENVRDAFAANFDEGMETGAAFTLYRGGHKVVDVWGGLADAETGRPWEAGTIAPVFSTTKGWVATCAHLLAQRGLLDFDEPVATYWPEFAANGKREIPVRWLLSHSVGLPVVDNPPSPDEVLRWDPLVDALAAQAPVWTPGEEHGYHAFTYGHLVGEVIRRISGRTVGRFLAEAVVAPLGGLEMWIGLPEVEEHRVARLAAAQVDAEAFDISELTDDQRAMAEAAMDPNSLTMRALNIVNPPLDWGSRAVRAAEIPAANGHASARAVARMYASLIGDVDGIRLFDDATLKTATEEQRNGPDRILFNSSRFALGYWLDCALFRMIGPSSFGHPGAGGSMGFADPELELAFGYVPNRSAIGLTGDPRSERLMAACREVIGA